MAGKRNASKSATWHAETPAERFKCRSAGECAFNIRTVNVSSLSITLANVRCTYTFVVNRRVQRGTAVVRRAAPKTWRPPSSFSFGRDGDAFVPLESLQVIDAMLRVAGWLHATSTVVAGRSRIEAALQSWRILCRRRVIAVLRLGLFVAHASVCSRRESDRQSQRRGTRHRPGVSIAPPRHEQTSTGTIRSQSAALRAVALARVFAAARPVGILIIQVAVFTTELQHHKQVNHTSTRPQQHPATQDSPLWSTSTIHGD